MYVVNLLYKVNPPDLVLLFMSIALKFASCFCFFFHRKSANNSFSVGMILVPREQKLVGGAKNDRISL